MTGVWSYDRGMYCHMSGIWSYDRGMYGHMAGVCMVI